MSSSSWHEIAHILAVPPPQPPAYLGALPPPSPAVNVVAFDTSAELLLTGNSNGGVNSWYGPALGRYTAWRADVRQTVAASKAAGDDDAPVGQRRLQTSWKKAPSLSQSHHSNVRSGIAEIYNDSGFVYSVTPGGIHCASRKGLAKWSQDVAAMGHPSLSLGSICASPAHSTSELIVAGSSSLERDQQVFSINKHVGGQVTRKFSAAGPILQVRKSQKYLLSSTPGGHIQCRDPRSLEIQHRLHAHPGGVIDMKSEGSLVWSVGWTMRLGHPVPEPLIKVHDLRSMRAMVPIPFAAPGGPALLDIHPRLSSTVVVAAPTGAWQIVDMNNPGEASFYQMNTAGSNSTLKSLSIAPSAEYIAFGEGDGSVRLWSTSEAAAALNHPETISSAPKFNSYSSQPLELPAEAETRKAIDWTAETSLSSIGLPHYDAPLLSVLPFEHYAAQSSPLFNPFPPKVDPGVLSSVRAVDGLHFGPLPRHLRGKRNVAKVTGKGFPPPPGRGSALQAGSGSAARGESRVLGLRTPMFRSEKIKAQQRNQGGLADGEAEEEAVEELGGGPPQYWRKKDIVYSKFGVEDFDFEFYNKTNQSGLETHIANCYLNSLLQCLYHLPMLRSLAEIHTLSGGKARCGRDDCLLCELSFLFMMLRDANGSNCQATNLLRAFAKSGKAVSLGLMDHDALSSSSSHISDVAYANLIQTVNRFLLDCAASSWAEMAVASQVDGAHHPVSPSLMEDALAPTTRVDSVCLSCGQVVSRPSKALVIDLVYPRKSLSNEPVIPSDFASVLKASLVRESVTKTTCKFCSSTGASIRTRRQLVATSKLPQVLSVNANIITEDQMSLWIDKPIGSGKSKERKTYLPLKLSIKSADVDGGQPLITELREGAQAPEGSAIYQLKSMVTQIQAPKEAAHLVSVARVPETHSGAGQTSESATWYLYNDFLVRPISEAEALSFPAATWRIPAVVFYERVDTQVIDIASIPWEKDLPVLTEDLNVSLHRDPESIRHRVLSTDEIPSPGDLVAIDAEFVALNPEELELSSSGTRSLIRPTTMSLARVSVLRGQGASECEPFIDDHIVTRERIFDYLTQFSGIIDGDLDPAKSRHTVIPQKLAYKKLRLLVDLGCVFIGHGLKKDFRIINIHVPPKQVIDTVDLYSSALQARKLSLRFLSWFLLKEDIQGTGAEKTGEAGGTGVVHGHDSIEDARAALHLYRIYETFQRDGRLEDVMEDLYEAGKRFNWRPPAAAAAGAGEGQASKVGTPTLAPAVLSGSL